MGSWRRSSGNRPWSAKWPPGLLLGPSLVGHFWPGAYTFLFPESSLDFLRLLSQVGVILFMFTRRPRARCGASAPARADGRRRQPLQHRRAVPARRRRLALALFTAARAAGRAVPRVRAVHGHRAEHHGVSGARAHPRGARPDADAARHDRPRLRGRRRRDGVDAAGVGRDPRDGGRRSASARGSWSARSRCSSSRWSGWCGRGSTARSDTRDGALNRPHWAWSSSCSLASALAHRDHRHPRALRRVPGRRRSCRRARRAAAAAARAARELQLGVPAAAVLRLHRTAHAGRAARRRRGWLVCVAIILVAIAGKLVGSMLARALDRHRPGTTRSCSAR